MPVEPLPCGPDGGTGTPGACSCAPSITSMPLCRADGTTVLIVVRSPCGDCGAPAADPVQVGWIDPATGAYTPGPPPADAGPCDTPGCVETVCRQRCDDTTGDGQPDTTYSELWCLAADGSATLLLTYQDDPATPYTPISPVECTYGCPESETVMLCDANGPFLRRYTFLAGTASYEDVALDGQTPHVVIGTPGVCPAAPDCTSPTTPTATVGLCLPDGTPIAVLLTRDCDGVTAQAGWVNLLTGAYSAGAPPAGAAACGDGSAFELAGILCDTDPDTGEVLGLALVEYSYNPDGSLAGVSLVNPADGSPYTLQGELRHCPTGQAQPDPDLVILCDVQADGAAVQFLRDYRRDENTQVVGHSDYTLAGAPYTVTGTVGQCPTEVPGPVPVIPQVFHGELVLCDDNGPFIRKLVQDAGGAVTVVVNLTLDGAPYTPVGTVAPCVPEAQPCRTTSTLLVCDLPSGGEPTPTVSDTDPTPYQGAGLGAEPLPGGAAALWAGGAISIPADTGPGPDHVNQHLRSVAATLQAERPGCDTGTATITASIRVQRTGPSSALGGNGIWSLWSGGTRVAVVTTPTNAPVGYTGTLTVSGQVSAADVAAGDVHLAGVLETWQTAAHVGGWIVDQFTASVVYDQIGCEIQFLRSVTLDCDGVVTAVTDSTLDGAPYTPVGEVGQCTPADTGIEPPPCPVQAVLQACRCDDADGDGMGEIGYVELLGVDCAGALTSLGTYTSDLTEPYAPISPVDCDEGQEEGADPAFGVQARRVELAAGQTWSAASYPTLQSVTAVAHDGTATITTVDGTSTLHPSESASWGVSRDTDALLTGPLTITAGPGTVTITFTTGVQL